jgi:ABC-type Fe3+/spermidine/putrescine transport system ATPase subunit
MSRTVAIEDLSKIFAGLVAAINRVSLVAEAGKITTLLGPSGCGKTTTLRCVAGLETPTAGEIRFADELVFSAARGVDVPTEKRRFGMIFQNYALWPHMTVGENVGFGLPFHGVARADRDARIRRALDLVRMSARVDALPGALSGGQQQRVALARALAYDPDILLLDEPLANLDAKLREAMRYELLEVQDRTGLTAIYVTHDQAEAMSISSKVVVMQNGAVADQGSPRDIYERPKSRFVAEFVGAGNFIDVRGIARAGNSVVAQTDIGAIAVEDGAADAIGTLMIRPEDIDLVAHDSDDGNVVTGKVIRQVYQGEYVVLFVSVGEQTLRVHVPRNQGLSAGAAASLRLPPDRLIGLPS